jgi:hypothetical protein
MNLTPSQLRRFWQEWPKSCKAMNWTRTAGLTTAEIDAKRKEFLAGCGFGSLTQVDRVAGFTKVLKELLVLQGVDLSAAREADDPSINRARVLRNKILTELVPCLEIYVEDVNGYITEIIEDKNRWWKIDRPARGMTLMDLDAQPIFRRDRETGELKEFPSQLDQMVYTLSACLNGSGKMRKGKKSRLGFRVAAGQTIHEMKIKAGVPCNCALICQRAGVNLVAPLPLPAAAPVEENSEPY